MNFKPVDDRVLIDLDEKETTTASGFILHHAVADAVNRGTVLAVGPGRYAKNGDTRIPMTIQVGDRIMFQPGSGLQIKIDGVNYLVLKEDEVIAIVEE